MAGFFTGVEVGVQGQNGPSIGIQPYENQFIGYPRHLTQPGLINQPGFSYNNPAISTATNTGNPPFQPQSFTQSGSSNIPAHTLPQSTNITGYNNQQPIIEGLPYGRIANTNNYIDPDEAMKKGFFSKCPCCPWWIWIIISLLVLGGTVVALIYTYDSNYIHSLKNELKRKHRDQIISNEEVKPTQVLKNIENKNLQNEKIISKSNQNLRTKSQKSTAFSAELKKENKQFQSKSIDVLNEDGKKPTKKSNSLTRHQLRSFQRDIN